MSNLQLETVGEPMADSMETLEAVKYANFVQLRQKHDELSADHEALKAAHNRLVGAHNNLVETVTDLQRLYSRLQAAAVKP